MTNEQIRTPFVILGDGIPPSVRDEPTSHVDVVPTIFSLLGARTHDAPLRRRVDVRAPADRFVLSTVGWEPRYAVVGKDLKVTVYAGLAGAQVTDPDDRPLPDGNARLAAGAGHPACDARRGGRPNEHAAPGADGGEGGRAGTLEPSRFLATAFCERTDSSLTHAAPPALSAST